MQRRAFLASLGALAACRRTHSDAIEVLISSDPVSLDPRFSIDVAGMRIARLVHATLTRTEPHSLAPIAGALVEALDLEKDGAVVLRLAKTARFHDGTSVTARDVLATFSALVDPALGSPSRRVLSHFTAPDAIDGPGGALVRFRPRAPRATLLADLDIPILKADEAASVRDTPLTGSGPFRIAARGAGLVSLTPAGEAPAKHALAIRTVRDEAARAMRVLGGRTDIVSNGLAPTLALSMPGRADAPQGLSAVTHLAAATTMLLLQNQRSPLDRLEVRLAIGHAIDRASLVTAKLAGAARLAAGLLPPTLAIPAPPQRPYDPAAARRTLSTLSEPLVLVTGTDRLRVGIARAIAQSLTDAGASVEVRSFELATLLARLSAGDFHLAPMIAPEVPDPESLRWYLHSAAIPPAAANRARVRDEDLDRWLDEGLAATAPAERRAIYAKIEARIHERCYVVPLFHEDHVVVTSARARGFRPTVDGRWSLLAAV